MTDAKSLPLSGYVIVSVYTAGQHLELKDSDAPDSDDVQFAWDWRLLEQDLFEVLVRLGIEAVKERPYAASVELVGRFRRMSSVTSVELIKFAHLQAVAILLPYARQALASLTLMTEPGAYHLPSVNVVALMEDFNAKDATGAKQLEELEGNEASAKPDLNDPPTKT